VYDPNNNSYRFRYRRGTGLLLTATPAEGYRVRNWIGADNDPGWNTNTNTVVLNQDGIVELEFEEDMTILMLVPEQYTTIEEAVAAAGPGGTRIIVSRGIHYITDPNGVDFAGKQLTLTSTHPRNPDVVANTIIDCLGTPDYPRRAFHFQSGEDANTVVQGLTIRNGYMRGPKGLDAYSYFYSYLTPDPYEPMGGGDNPPPRAQRGGDAVGNGYGGAIFCENASSPKIIDCVITDCTVTGAQGGTGAIGNSTGNGYPDNWEYVLPDSNDVHETGDGQWGGYGGAGAGYGYGGGIACINKSSPQIIDCTLQHNIARGGCGGDGGAGGDSAGGNESYGGPGGAAIGDGYGGGIYADSGSAPLIVDCNFINNIATTGLSGQGAPKGTGNALDPRAIDGYEGYVYSYGGVAGGAAYFKRADANITGSVFIGNRAYEGRPQYYYYYYEDSIYDDVYEEEVQFQTRGGAIYAGLFSTVALDNCSFSDSLGGAVHVESLCDVDVNECEFNDNVLTAGWNPTNEYYYGYGYSYSYYSTSYYYYDYYDYTYGILGLTGLGLGVGVIEPPDYTGAGIHVGPDCNNVSIRDSVFTGNTASGDGGAVNCRSDANFVDCWFGGNRTSSNGGAVDAFYFVDTNDPNIITTLELNLTSCGFASNKAYEGVDGWGGAVHFQDFNGTFTDCYFINNIAKNGGALFLSAGTVDMVDGVIHGNMATGASGIVLGSDANDSSAYAYYGGGYYYSGYYGIYGTYDYSPGVDESLGVDRGGGLFSTGTNTRIANYTISDNVVEGVNGSGGGLNFYGGDATYEVTNCLLTGNSATVEGGAISCEIFAMPDVNNCTFVDNSAGSFGGAVFNDWTSDTVIRDSIFANCNNAAILEEDFGGNTIDHCLFHNNPDGDYGIYDSVSEEITAFSGTDPNVSLFNAKIDPSSNIVDDPLFVTEPNRLGDYYLSQPPDQIATSPAVDRGSRTSTSAGFFDYVTSTSSDPDVNDVGIVDIGYHYRKFFQVDQYDLTAQVLGGNGRVEPTSGRYYKGALVGLKATPDTGHRVGRWLGTADDATRSEENTVVMMSDRDITVEFEQPKTIIVGSEPNYTTIQSAIDAAGDGDIVILPTGTYTSVSPYPTIYMTNKGITLTSSNPDDPCSVAATVLQNYYIYVSTLDSTQAVIDGITIDSGSLDIANCSPIVRNCVFLNCRSWGGSAGTPDPDQALPGYGDGWDGGSVAGGAMVIYNGSPQVLNCQFANCSVTGGDGGRGANGVDHHPEGYDGGWAGWAYGGAVYIGYKSDPLFQNCSFANCYARGGDGGNGGNGVQGWYGGRGGNWTWGEAIERDIATWWDGWYWGPFDIDGLPRTTYYLLDYDQFGFYRDYWKHSGYGGAVYCEWQSSPTFIDCNFVNNRSYGGVSGIGGTPVRRPFRRLNIENFGGAFYAGYGSDVELINCSFTKSLADPNTIANPDDIYVSYGGAIAFEGNTTLKMVNCDVTDSEACVGGAIYWSDATIEMIDCNITDSVAYHGAGLYAAEAFGTISGSTITENQAYRPPAPIALVIDPNDPNAPIDPNDPNDPIDPNDPNAPPPLPPAASGPGTIFGQGGGYYSYGSLVDVNDTIFSRNQASASGGGIYYSGSDQVIGEAPLLHNCLLAENRSGRDGGGISVNWHAGLKISNCTIVDNVVSGTMGDGAGFGGGLYCSYQSIVEVVNSIIWDNFGINGAQIAIAAGSTYEPRQSLLTVTNTDIGPEYDPNQLALFTSGELGAGGLTDGGDAGSRLVDAQTLYDQFDAGRAKVDVLVTLTDPAILRAATRWDVPASVTVLRAEIARRQSTVTSSLSVGEFTSKYTYENLSALSGAVSREGLNKLLANPTVAHIEPVRYARPALRQAISLASAMEVRQIYDGSGIAIAIVDTGIDYTHPMLGGGGFPNAKVIGGYDFADNDRDPMPRGGGLNAGHGTACAGIAAGYLGTAGDYIGGVASNAKLYALKVTSDADVNDIFPTYATLAAWDWCITHRDDDPSNPIRVISNSWGIYGAPFNDPHFADTFSPAMTHAADTATALGITILAASGNDGCPLRYRK